MAKYESFIELTPGYESVINLSSKKDDKEFWKQYIVNDDIVRAVKLICKSLRPDDKNEIWHFWIQGPYGTGKSFAALVLQHLLGDDYATIEEFMRKNRLFAEVRDKFLGIRKKGKYYVTFRDGECDALNTASKFLFEIEKSVRSVLSENGFSYTGKDSLIDAVKEKIREFKGTLKEKFDAGDYQEHWAVYNDFEDFYEEVQERNVDACKAAQQILEDMNIGLASGNVDTFKHWLKDVFDGNPELKKTGIFIIWDEFTDYIRYNDLNIIEQLSKFTQENVPLYMIYVIHKYPGLISEDLQAHINHSDARFYKIPITLSEDTTFKLIGESIITKDGMASNWAEECNSLYSSIQKDLHYFMPDPSVEMNASDWKKIFPIHPMSVNLVSKVAGDAASNRSIFKFLKSDDADGFKSYIRNNGPDDWKWVTPDYLWDYYFINDGGGVKDLSQNAKDALVHYNRVQHLISDKNALRIFKAAMLLLATVGSSRTMRRTRGSNGIQATEKTLCHCFAGQLDNDIVSEYLTALGPGKNSDGINVIALAPEKDDRRLELPYSGGTGELKAEIEKLKAHSPISTLLESKSPFGSALINQFFTDEKPVVKRLIKATCWGTTQQIRFRLKELTTEINKAHHCFGMLIVAVPDINSIDKIKTTVKEEIDQAGEDRLMACILRHPLDNDLMEQWYSNSANAILAQKSGNTVNSNNYNNEADLLCSTWVSVAVGKEMFFVATDGISTVYSNRDAINAYEKNVFKHFPYIPERFVKKTTVYTGIKLPIIDLVVNKKDSSAYNKQWIDIVEDLQNPSANIFDCNTVEEALQINGSVASECVTKLIAYIDDKLTSGTVFLSDFWDDLQRDLGYYKNAICAYLLGFVFKFYAGKFTWDDGTNSHPLDEKTIPSMIAEMCNGKKTGMKIASESDVAKRFKKISTKIFNLPEKEVGDLAACRKKIKIKIPQNGYPIWALKYLDDDAYAGLKNQVLEIINYYHAFILEIGNQNEVMEDTVAIFKENAKTYENLLTALVTDKSKMLLGITNFIFSRSPNAKTICESYHFSFNTLYNTLKKSMEEEIWQWKEEAVSDKIQKLVLDLEMIGIVNKSLDGTAESVEKVRSNLENILNYIRIPGCIYEKLDFPWVSSLKAMRSISLNKWISYDAEEKQKIITVLEQYMPEVIEKLNNPIDVLKVYIEYSCLGTFSSEELNTLLSKLPKESYDQTENNFKKRLKEQIDALAYSKKTKILKNIWQNGTGTDSVKNWSQQYLMPVIWAVPEMSKHLGTLLSIEGHERVDMNCLDSAIAGLQGFDFTILRNKSVLDEIFIQHVSSDKNREIILPHLDELKAFIKTHHPLISSWQSKIVNIRKLTETFIHKNLKTVVEDKAKLKIAAYDENQLRKIMTKILENCVDACAIILDE